MHDLGIVIVNWNTREYLDTCLQTVFASRGDFSYTVVVVDNASDDGSPDMVAENYPQVQLIRSDENTGYPRGNNMGLRALGYRGPGDVDAEAPRYALLLNPDTQLPPDALFNMMKFMDQRPDVGVAGPKLILADGSLDKACRRGFPTPMVSLYHYSGLAKLFPKSERFGRYNMTFADVNDEIEVDSVVGAYMQIRKEAIEQTGLLDEVFFMYAEDIDWCYRIKQAGWKVWYHPAVTVYHIKRAASSQSRKAQFEFWRAMLIFYRKHYRATTPIWLHSLIMMGLLLKGGGGLWQEIRQPTPPLIPS
ncbi:glycosyltransferase family 2 protein [Phototrophicus methaneseepsis]|uniref:Glycosyltransferase family 2 protein n=1 Tax=Phototrophicus methaneseepsis TaxID=2710758 RepID=A0A7S8E7Q4_9CHLR|nr:glycosyltransferase family 2 protein [Phototrophicus methaneseepsis]QPC81896.1 glycosyltransferase family 2 protein [Phototrophicus methaneseepsis]